MDCMRGHFANRGGCSPCKDSRTAMIWRGSVAVFGIVVAGGLAAFMWYRVAAAQVEFTGAVPQFDRNCELVTAAYYSCVLDCFGFSIANSLQLVANSSWLVLGVWFDFWLVLQQNTYWCACHVFPEVGFSWKQSRTLRSCCRPASFGLCCQRFPHLKVLNVVRGCAALLTGK